MSLKTRVSVCALEPIRFRAGTIATGQYDSSSRAQPRPTSGTFHAKPCANIPRPRTMAGTTARDAQGDSPIIAAAKLSFGGGIASAARIGTVPGLKYPRRARRTGYAAVREQVGKREHGRYGEKRCVADMSATEAKPDQRDQPGDSHAAEGDTRIIHRSTPTRIASDGRATTCSRLPFGLAWDGAQPELRDRE